jgi:hypothetical protein
VSRFDAENRPPTWELLEKPELEDGSTYYGGQKEMVFRQYISEMAENSAGASLASSSLF